MPRYVVLRKFIHSTHSKICSRKVDLVHADIHKISEDMVTSCSFDDGEIGDMMDGKARSSRLGAKFGGRSRRFVRKHCRGRSSALVVHSKGRAGATVSDAAWDYRLGRGIRPKASVRRVCHPPCGLQRPSLRPRGQPSMSWHICSHGERQNSAATETAALLVSDELLGPSSTLESRGEARAESWSPFRVAAVMLLCPPCLRVVFRSHLSHSSHPTLFHSSHPTVV